MRGEYNALESFVGGFSVGLGFLLPIVLMSNSREKLETEWVPMYFRGVLIAFLPVAVLGSGRIGAGREKGCE